MNRSWQFRINTVYSSINAMLCRNRQMVSQLKNSMDNSGVNDQVASLERQIDRLRSDKVDTENYY